MDWEEEGKGRRGEGDAQTGEKIGQRPQLLADFRFGFQRGRWGQKGSVSAGRECRPFGRGWGEGFRGFWTLSGGPASPLQAPGCSAAPSTRLRRVGSLQGGGEAKGCFGHPQSGWWKLRGALLSSPPKGSLGTRDGLVAWFHQLGSDRS